jgi:hypothetical protein
MYIIIYEKKIGSTQGDTHKFKKIYNHIFGKYEQNEEIVSFVKKIINKNNDYSIVIIIIVLAILVIFLIQPF